MRCRNEAPAVAEVQAQLGDQVTFLGLPSRSEDVQSMVDFVDETGVGGFEHLIDADGLIWEELGVTDQPAFAFVNDDGTVDVHVGALGGEELTSRLEALIAS